MGGRASFGTSTRACNETNPKPDLHGDGVSPDPGRAARWHQARRARALLVHPSIRKLAGPSATTALFVLALVPLQLAIGVTLRRASIGVIVGVAYVVGAVLVHALAALIHECAHDLVFRAPWANRALALFANLPIGLPGAIDFQEKHIMHHRHLGEGSEVDFQMPTDEAIRWVASGGVVRKLVYLSFGSLVFPDRTVSRCADEPENLGWKRANAVVQMVAGTTYIAAFGGRAFTYAALSALFAFGPHPAGIRGFGRHFAARPDQPTVSYDGALNWVSFNVGLHVEHHDFPSVPWHRLPRVRRIAPELYEGLLSWSSWTVLLARYLLRSDHAIDCYVETRAARAARERSEQPPSPVVAAGALRLGARGNDSGPASGTVPRGLRARS